MAAKQIIVLVESTNGQQMSIDVLFWYPISANPVPQTAGSAWTAGGASQGASTAENQAIQAGTIREERGSFQFPVGTNPVAIQEYLQQAWVQRNNVIAGQGADLYYGIFFDGTQWTQG